jgi:8-oxo-dGTP diphosphatase
MDRRRAEIDRCADSVSNGGRHTERRRIPGQGRILDAPSWDRLEPSRALGLQPIDRLQLSGATTARRLPTLTLAISARCEWTHGAKPGHGVPGLHQTRLDPPNCGVVVVGARSGTAQPSSTAVIFAAGGLVWREIPPGREVAVIHRSRYGDWTLPKGKLEPAESLVDAAVREVREETGCQVRVGTFAGAMGYEVRGVPKIVAMWNMEVIDCDPLGASDEVDGMEWLSVEAATKRLDHALERSLVATAGGALAALFSDPRA